MQAPSLNVRILTLEKKDDTPPPREDPDVPQNIATPLEPPTNISPTLPDNQIPPTDNSPLPTPTKKDIATILSHVKPNYEKYDDLESYHYQMMYIDIPSGINPEEFFQQLKQKY
jgi:hypothetical protein